MKKRLMLSAVLIAIVCSCDTSTKQRTESDDGPVTGSGVGHDGGTGDRPTATTDFPNRRKHTFVHPYIVSINANVDAVKFFEGSYYPPQKEQRQYRVSFDRRKTRYINWELNLSHKPPAQTVSFQIDSEWYKSGKLFYRHSTSNSIEANWEYSYMSHSYNMAPWTRGIYRVDLSIGGQKIASEYFDVYNADCSGDLSFAGTDKVDQLRREAESYRYGGNNSQYQDAVLYLAMALHNRAGQCFLNGNLDGAYQDFTEAIQLQPSFRMAYYHRSQVLMDLKRAKDALADLDVALRGEEDDDYYAARARVQFTLENDPEAFSDLNRAIDINSKRPELYHDRGIVLYYLGEDQNALSDLKQAASMYQSRNEQDKYRKVSSDIDVLEGRIQGQLKLYDSGRNFTLAELKN
jgi:tetratricopeptide (TPR) repeat protein